MKNKIFYGFIILVSFILISTTVRPKSGVVHVLRLEGIIDPVAVEYVTSGIKDAVSSGATCVVLEMDTPGGLDSSMRKICQVILNSSVPVVTYIYPAGARSASAGVFITMASQISAMAPGTNIGAAHPVDMGGNKLSDKITNDAAAYARTIAVQHARNADWAEEAVRKSVSLTDLQAVNQNVVDMSAKNLNDLLQQINGRKIPLPNSSEVILNTTGAEIVEIPMSMRQNFLHTLANPNIAYILMLVGIYGLIYELAAPGIGLAGIAGGICILMALVSFEALPFNLAGLLLILFSMGLFIADIKAPTHGVLTAGGIITLILGSMLIFSPQGTAQAPYISARVSWITIIIMTLFSTAFFVLVVSKGLQAMKRPAALGTHLMMGAIGTVVTDLHPEGIVHLQSEEWKAVTDSTVTISKGEKVRVTRIDGLTVHVEKV